MPRRGKKKKQKRKKKIEQDLGLLMLSLEKCQSRENSGLNKQHPTCRLVKQPKKYPYRVRVFSALEAQRKLASPLTMSGAKEKKINVLLAKVASPSDLRPGLSLVEQAR